MTKKRGKKNAVLSAHATEQMEGVCNHFLVHLEHYNIEGCLFLRSVNNEDQILVFSNDSSRENFKALLEASCKISNAGANAILDKKE